MTVDDIRAHAQRILSHPDAIEHWLVTPNALLENQAPIDYINAGREQDLRDFIDAIADGTFDWGPFSDA